MSDIVENESVEPDTADVETDTAAVEVDSDGEAGDPKPAGRKGVRQKIAEQTARIEELTDLLDRTRAAQYRAVLEAQHLPPAVAEAQGMRVEHYLDDSGLLDLDRLTYWAALSRQAQGLPSRPKGNPLAGRTHSDGRAITWGAVTSRALPGGN